MTNDAMAGPITRCARRVVAGLSLSLLIVCAWAAPAAAHGPTAAGNLSSNYRVSLTAAPNVGGLSIDLADGGTEVVLANRSQAEVTVLDYDGDPYLRIGPDGVWENSNSPAVELNSAMTPPQSASSAASSGEPRWHRLSAGHVAKWHDHRAHWMAADPSGPIADRVHVVQTWTIPMLIDGEPAAIAGIIEWVPPPAFWPWLLVIVVVTAAVFALVQRRPRRGLVIVTAIVAALALVGTAGMWLESSGSVTDRIGSLTLPGLTIALFAGAALTWQNERSDALWLALAASLTVLATAMLGTGRWLTRSQLPTTLSPDLARAVVATSISVGLAVSLWSAWQLWSSRRAAAFAGEAIG